MNEKVSSILIDRTFTAKYSRLPTIAEAHKEIVFDDDFDRWEETLRTSAIRRSYVKYSFPILTHEFIYAFAKTCSEMKFMNIIELSCGIGWLSYWLNKYNIPISKSVDNMTWVGYEDRYLKHVTRQDSVQCVIDSPTADLFILSWPYMDEVAENIWHRMNRNQYLFYIGEGMGGCTANDAFFGSIEESEIEDGWKLKDSFISFWGIHDSPLLLRK